MHRYRHSFVQHTFVSIEFSVFSVVHQMITGILCWSILRPRPSVIYQLGYLCNNCCCSNNKRKLELKFFAMCSFSFYVLMSRVSFRCPQPAIVATSLSKFGASSFEFDAMHIGRTVLLNAIGSLISSRAIGN